MPVASRLWCWICSVVCTGPRNLSNYGVIELKQQTRLSYNLVCWNPYFYPFLRWQSQNGLHNVSIQLNLDTQFQFISTILRFKTYRPAAMYLERSYDFGRTWKRYAYFSNDCKRDFPAVPEGTRKSLTDVTCTGVYSQLTPSEGGVVSDLNFADPSFFECFCNPWFQ